MLAHGVGLTETTLRWRGIAMTPKWQNIQADLDRLVTDHDNMGAGEITELLDASL